jgi:hypothetical protein
MMVAVVASPLVLRPGQTGKVYFDGCWPCWVGMQGSSMYWPSVRCGPSSITDFFANDASFSIRSVCLFSFHQSLPPNDINILPSKQQHQLLSFRQKIISISFPAMH